MSIQKITQLATNVLSKVQKMPLPKQLGLAALATTGVFGLGFIAGQLLVGDSFEKKQAENTEIVPDSIAKQKNVEEKIVEEKSEFEYIPPKVGERGIVSVDTVYSDKTQKPEIIRYNDNNGNTKHEALLDKDGALIKFTITNKDGSYETFDNKGNCINSLTYYSDGTSFRYTNDDLMFSQETYDKHGRIVDDYTSYKGNDPRYFHNSYEYKQNGDYIEKINSNSATKERNKVNYYNKHHELIKSKQLDGNGLLLYTVTPKYDQDGDIIKRDTVWVNK